MSDVSGGSGWWLASDGKWYPPEAEPGRPPDSPLAGLPLLAPLPTDPRGAIGTEQVWSTGGPVAGGGVPDVDEDSEPRHRARPGAIALGVVIACVVMIVGARGLGWLVAKGSSSSSGTSASTATTPTGDASGIGLRAADLGPGFTATGTVDPVQHSAPGPCTPLSGGPWISNQSSPYFTAPSGNLTAESDVVVMPTSRDAQAALSAINAPSYGTDCFLADTNSSVTSALSSMGTSCGLSLQDPQISKLSAPTQNGELTGYHYVADILCAQTGNSEPYTMDIVDQVVGPVFLQARFRSIGTPPTAAFEAQAMQSMATRARVAKG